MRLMTIATTMASALVLVACNPQTNDGPANAAQDDATDVIDTNSAGNDTAMMDNSVAASAAPMTAQQFADTAAASDAYELASSRLAVEKATSADLKGFAEQMIKDHTASTAKLKAAAGSITPAPAMNAEQQANIAALQGASGAAFDTAYRTQQLAAHQKTLAALQGYASAGEDASLKAFAGETAPVVQHHLTMLQGMQ